MCPGLYCRTLHLYSNARYELMYLEPVNARLNKALGPVEVHNQIHHLANVQNKQEGGEDSPLGAHVAHHSS